MNSSEAPASDVYQSDRSPILLCVRFVITPFLHRAPPMHQPPLFLGVLSYWRMGGGQVRTFFD